MGSRLRCFWMVGTVAGAMAGCAGIQAAGGAAVPFARGEVEIETGSSVAVWQVEVASTPAQHGAGLSGREEIPSGSGMLFLFEEDQPGSAGFWMRRTHVPLSIAYIDSEWTVVAMRDMEPCRRLVGLLCPRYPPGMRYRAALEVPRGDFERAGVEPGDRVRFRPYDGPGRGATGTVRPADVRAGPRG